MALVAMTTFAQTALPQTKSQKFTPNFRDAEISQVIETVGLATGRNILIDPRVKGRVTLISSSPMSADALYEAFLATLQIYGYVAITDGGLTKIMPETNFVQYSGNSEIITQIVSVKNVSAAQLIPILRPLLPQYGHLAAAPNSNSLIIADRANNVARLIKIIRRLDEATTADIEVVALQNASANEIMQTLMSLSQNAENSGMNQIKIASDSRSNSIILSGDQGQRLKAKATIAFLDTPLTNGGNTRVRYLRYADAEKIAAKLKEQVATVAPAQGGGPAERPPIIWAEPETNSLVITAPAKTMDAIMGVVDQLDIRRAQVLVEAIIVEISEDRSAELGVNWVAAADATSQVVGGFTNPVGGASILDLIRGADNPTGVTSAPRGLTIGGVGRIDSGNINFAAMLRALRGDSNTNIIATPSIVTMDNQEAEIKVTQEVPFVTGQFTNTGGTGNSVSPFQTIQRQEVGTILKITPQINEGNTIMLRISQESSSLAGSSRGAVDLITNKRTISTNVMVEDSGIIVLGGLIQDSETRGEQRVPLLGKIPLIGELFRTRSATKNKTNLMVFIQPRILRDDRDSRIQTNGKYNYIRQQQTNLDSGFELTPLMPKKTAILPKLEERPDNKNQ